MNLIPKNLFALTSTLTSVPYRTACDRLRQRIRSGRVERDRALVSAKHLFA
jgi:hypothetical protein